METNNTPSFQVVGTLSFDFDRRLSSAECTNVERFVLDALKEHVWTIRGSEGEKALTAWFDSDTEVIGRIIRYKFLFRPPALSAPQQLYAFIRYLEKVAKHIVEQDPPAHAVMAVVDSMYFVARLYPESCQK